MILSKNPANMSAIAIVVQMGCDVFFFDWQIDRGGGREKLKDREKWSRGPDQRAEHGYRQPATQPDEDEDKPTDGTDI